MNNKELEKEIVELKRLVAEQQKFINLQKQDVQLADRGQLAFPLTLNTINLLIETIQPFVVEQIVLYGNTIVEGYNRKHFYFGSDAMTGGTLTILLPDDPVPDPVNPINLNTGSWLVGDCTLYITPLGSGDFSQIDIDALGVVTDPLDNSVYIPNFTIVPVSTAPGLPDEFQVTCNDPNYTGTVNYVIYRSYNAIFWKN